MRDPSAATSDGKNIVEGDTVPYERLIAQHIATRLRAFPKEEIARVLALCELEWDGSTVRSQKGTPVGPETSRRYKRAILEVCGSAAYGMTKVNFALAGCKCRDCASGTSDVERPSMRLRAPTAAEIEKAIALRTTRK